MTQQVDQGAVAVAPRSLGWLRRPDLDRPGQERCIAWERPDGWLSFVGARDENVIAWRVDGRWRVIWPRRERAQ